MDIVSILLLIDFVLFLVLVGICIVFYYRWEKYSSYQRECALQKLEDKLEAGFEVRKKVSLDRQRGKVSGDDIAKFLPMAEDYLKLYNTRDMVVLSDVTDYLVFVGKVDKKIIEVVFQEVKLDGVPLTDSQKCLRECIEEGKIRWETWVFDRGSKIFKLRQEGRRKRSGGVLDGNNGRVLIGSLGLVEVPVEEGQKADKRKREKIFKQIAKAQKEGKEITYVVQTEGQKE